MKITAYVASAFSNKPRRWQQSSVVFMTQPLTRTKKMAIAKELDLQKLLLFQTQRLLISALNILHQKKKSICGPRDNWRFHHYEALK